MAKRIPKMNEMNKEISKNDDFEPNNAGSLNIKAEEVRKSLWIKEPVGNYSNGKKDAFNEKNGYVGIRLQQGVPLLDRDWNELEDIRRYHDMILRRNYVGDGTPDDGFKITEISGEKDDFLITGGRYLVEGIEAFNPSEIRYTGSENGNQKKLDLKDGVDYNVYIDLHFEEIHGVEELKNPQDVKMETCARHKAVWNVKVDETIPKQSESEQNYNWYSNLAGIKLNGPKLEITDRRRYNGRDKDIDDLRVNKKLTVKGPAILNEAIIQKDAAVSGTLKVDNVTALNDQINVEKPVKFNDKVSAEKPVKFNEIVSVKGIKAVDERESIKLYSALSLPSLKALDGSQINVDSRLSLHGELEANSFAIFNNRLFVRGDEKEAGIKNFYTALQIGINHVDQTLCKIVSDERQTLKHLAFYLVEPGSDHSFSPVYEMTNDTFTRYQGYYKGAKSRFYGSVVIESDSKKKDNIDSDIAKAFLSDGNLMSNQLVCLDKDGKVRLTDKDGDTTVIGVTCIAPSLLLYDSDLKPKSQIGPNSREELLKILENRAKTGVMPKDLFKKFKEGSAEQEEILPYLHDSDAWPFEADNVNYVTLSGIAVCHIDGDASPGDLLISSKKSGYVKVDKNPKPGTIIGKALGVPYDNIYKLVKMLVFHA